MKRLSALLLALSLLTGCGGTGPAPDFSTEDQSLVEAVPGLSPEEYLHKKRSETVSRLLSAMTVEEKVGQVFFARCPAENGPALAQEYHLGGYLLFSRDFRDKSAQEVREAVDACQQAACLPLLIGVDEEGGTVVRISSNPQLRENPFLSPRQLREQGGLEAVTADTAEKDALLHTLGVNVNFAPVADLSDDPEDFIYPRTFGGGAEATSRYTAAVTGQMEADGLGSVLKHFPGYGANRDTHTGSALDSRPLDQFLTQDLLPFRAGLDAASGGTAAVLVSHNIVQAVDPDRPASLSPAVLALLREELAFEGVALTDALDMDAVAAYTGESSAAVLALAAGVDMVVTTDFQTQIPQVLEALASGRLSQERLDQAVSRVLGWKYDLGLLADAS